MINNSFFIILADVIGLVVAFMVVLVALIGVSGVFIVWFCKQHSKSLRMQKRAQSCKDDILLFNSIINKLEPLNCCSMLFLYFNFRRPWNGEKGHGAEPHIL